MNEGDQINKAEGATTEKATDSFADLLRVATSEPEKAQPEQTGTEGKAAEKQKKAKPKSLAELAEKLDLKEEDLYEIAVPMRNAEPTTLGELKDAKTKQEDFSRRELEAERTRTKREQEDLLQDRQLKELLALLPKEALTEKAQELVRKRYEQKLEHVRAAVREIPEWADKERQTQDLTAMAKYAESFGLPTYFLTSIDHPGLLKMVRSAWALQDKVDKVLAQVEVKPPQTQVSKPGKPPKKSSPTPQVRNGPSPDDGYRQLLNSVGE